MYGVESVQLESGDNAATHRATRKEILAYYANVQSKLEKQFDFQFYGGVDLDLAGPSAGKNEFTITTGEEEKTIIKARKVVDARFLQPDLPVFVGPKFTFDAEKIKVLPANALADSSHEVLMDDAQIRQATDVAATRASDSMKYVIIGGGKTGMDAIIFLMTAKRIEADDILWVVPNEAWITAREDIASCMELLHTSVQEAKLCMQTQGKR
jgi:hypothetical protein